MQLLTALAVLATEEGGETGGGLSLIVPPASELIAGVIAFLIVFWFVGRRAMPMINRTLEARQQAITGQLTEEPAGSGNFLTPWGCHDALKRSRTETTHVQVRAAAPALLPTLRPPSFLR